ncbi:alpha/beta hydrolase, partial [Mycobacterium sp.]|uniref:alpha/beta hydrolase n=1 Tax=Mycobacterium sp. TaxID=1785 RepID=UPI002C8A415D
MSWVTRAPDIARDLSREMTRVVPRTLAGLNESTGWVPASPRGVRQFGEVMLDELVLSGFSVLGGRPAALRPPSECAAAADELSELGIDRAHSDPAPLRVRSLRRQRVAGLTYERMTFEHDPALPKTLEAEGLGGPARAVVHLCRHRDGPRPWLIWVHGAGQGGPEDLLLSRIGRIYGLGYNVALPIQPGHGSRRRHWPRYPDMDPLGNVAGMMRVVSEVRAVVQWAQPQATAVVVAGISMGTPVAALVSHLERQTDAVALYTPILGLNAMIARHLGRWGTSRDGYRELLGSTVVSQLTSVIDPLQVDPAAPPDRRLIVG